MDLKPWNAHYERPAVLSLLPPLAGLRVLDAGCGSGWYAEQLARSGAMVTAFDRNERFVALTRARVAGFEADVLRADLSDPLSFAADETFDAVVCPLVLHYVRDWGAPLKEFHRILKPGGILVFSTHHPFMDWKLFERADYFAIERLDDTWDVGPVSFYRRPLNAMSEALDAAGFWIERLLEPRPTEEFRQADPAGYERLQKNPWFLVIRARHQSVPKLG